METRVLNISSYDINASDTLADYYNKTVSTAYGTVSDNRWSLTWNNIDMSKVMGDEFYNRYNLFKISLVTYNLATAATSRISTAITAQHYQDFHVNWFLQGLPFYPDVSSNSLSSNGALLTSGYIPLDVSYANYTVTTSLAWTFRKVKTINLSLNMKCAATNSPYNPASDSNYLWGHSNLSLQIVGVPEIYYPTPASLIYGATLAASLNASAVSGISGEINYYLDNTKTVTALTSTVLNYGNTSIYAVFTPTSSFYNSYTQAVTQFVNKASTSTLLTAITPIVYGNTLGTSVSSSGSMPGTFNYFLDASFSVGVTTATILNAGTYTIYSRLTPTSNNYFSSSDSKPLVVNKAATFLTFPNITSILYGVVTGSTTIASLLNGTVANISGGIYTFFANGTPINSSTVLGAGTYTISCQYTSPDDNYASCTGSTSVVIQAHPTSATYSVSTPTRIIYGTDLTSVMNATAGLVQESSVAGTIRYYTDASYNNEVLISNILPVGSYTVYAVFRPTNTNDYLTSYVTTPLTVAQMPTTITPPGPQTIVYNTDLSGVLSSSVLTNVGQSVSGSFGFYYDNSSVPVANYVNYQYYKFTPTALRDASASGFQISELDLRYNGARVDYSNAIASNVGSTNPAGELVVKAIDNVTTTKSYDHQRKPIIINFGTPTRVSDYTFATANDTIGRDPISWEFSGSNDNSTWTTLDTKTSYPTTIERYTYLNYFEVGRLNVANFPESSAANYRYYQFTPVALRGSGTSGVQISELNLRYNGTRVDYSTAIASNPGGATMGQDTVIRTIDGLTTASWNDYNKKPIIIDFGKNTRVSDYTFATATDVADRDPISWVFSGSNDNSSWTILDTQTNYPTPTARQTYLSYFPVVNRLNVGSYTIYAKFTPSSTNFAVSTSSYSLSVTQKPTTITFPTTLIDASYNSSLSPFIAGTYADVSGAFTFTDATATTLTTSSTYTTLGQQLITANFVPTNTNYANSTSTYSALYVRFAAPFTFNATTNSITYGTDLSGILTTNVPSFLGVAISGTTTHYLTAVGGTVITNSTYLVPATYTVKSQFVPADTTRYYIVNTSNTKTITVSKQYVYPVTENITAYVQSPPANIPIIYYGLVLGDTSSNSMSFTSATIYYVQESSSFSYPYVSSQPKIPAYNVYNDGFAGTVKYYNVYVILENFSSSKYEQAFNKYSVIINKIPTALAFTIPESLKLIPYGTSITSSTLNATITNTLTSTPVSYGVNYRYYKFTPVAIRLPAIGTVQISELNLRYNGTRVDYSTATASNPGGSNDSTHYPSKAIDNLTTTKWLDHSRKPLFIDFGKNTRVSDYTFATGNDVPDRDPVSWQFSGSYDNTTWTTLDTQTNYPTPTARQTYLSYFPIVNNSNGQVTYTLSATDMSQNIVTNSVLNAGAYYIYARYIDPLNIYINQDTFTNRSNTVTVTKVKSTVTTPNISSVVYGTTMDGFISGTTTSVPGSLKFYTPSE